MSSVKIELREDQVEKIHAICDSFDNREGELINVLHKTQGTFGYLPAEVQEVIAEKMGIPYPSLARYWQGRAVFPAALIRSLFLATDQNIRVAEFMLLEGSDYRLERISSTPEKIDISRSLMVLNKMEGEISGLYLAATHEDSEHGEKISFAEARALSEALRKLSRLAEDLRSVIKNLHDIE